MYKSFYGLAERPFDLTPNPRYLLRTPQHREALCTITYAITGGKSISVVVGEAGTGKTTVIRAAIASLPAGARVALVSNPTLTRGEFFECTSWKLGLSNVAHTSKASFLMQLQAFLDEHHRQRLPVALIVDEAHTLSHELLEEIRLLANHQADDANLISVVLAGQPELGDRLNSNALRQIKQRVALRATLRAFTIDETAAYIAGRVRVAGGDTARLFTREAVGAIHEAARGIPRSISVVCDNALIAGFALGQRPVRRDTVAEVVRDLDLRAAGETMVIAPPASGRDSGADAANLQVDTAPTRQVSELSQIGRLLLRR